MKKASSRKMAKKTPSVSVRPGRPSKDSADADSLTVACDLYNRLIGQAESDGDTYEVKRLKDELRSFADCSPSVEWLRFRESWSRRDAVRSRKDLAWDSDIPKDIGLPTTLRVCAGLLLEGAPFDLESRPDLVREAGEWLLQCMADADAQRISKLAKLIRVRKSELERWHSDDGESAFYRMAGFFDDGRSPGVTSEQANAGYPLAKILVYFAELWKQQSQETSWGLMDRTALPNKKQIAERCGVDREDDNERRTFDRRLKQLGLDGLPAS
jgi:hypothetical protein